MNDICLFWDFHGTLTKPESLWSVNVYKVLKENNQGKNITLENVKDVLDNDGFPWHNPHLDYTGIKEPTLWWEYVEKLFYNTYIRLGLSDEIAKNLSPLVKDKILEIDNYKLYDDTIKVLSTLKGRGYKNIILSNNFPELKDICDGLLIGEYFDDFVISALEGYDKPRPELFEIAINKTNNSPECYMIGDNPIADVQGGKNAGMKTIYIGKGTYGDYNVNSLTEILNILK